MMQVVWSEGEAGGARAGRMRPRSAVAVQDFSAFYDAGVRGKGYGAGGELAVES